jgi:hypothetical protein
MDSTVLAVDGPSLTDPANTLTIDNVPMIPGVVHTALKDQGIFFAITSTAS